MRHGEYIWNIHKPEYSGRSAVDTDCLLPEGDPNNESHIERFDDEAYFQDCFATQALLDTL